MKIGVKDGFWDEYRWCFSIEQVISAVMLEGPVVVGTDWYSGMDSPDMTGRLTPNGVVVGGHCWLIYGYIPSGAVNTLTGRKVPSDIFLMQNSWGYGWGLAGCAWITVEDFDVHLRQHEGEVAVPMGRRDPTYVKPNVDPKPQPIPERKPTWKWIWDRIWKRWRRVLVR
jgi:hypothetical protein